jgi:tetratricopeptide (TPR) repeat protein
MISYICTVDGQFLLTLTWKIVMSGEKNDRRVCQEAIIKLRNAMSQQTAGRHESALTSIEEALAIQENYIDAWLMKGVLLGKIGKCNEAIKCYDKALEIDEDNTDAWRLKGATYSSIGLFDKALDCSLKAVDASPGNLILKLDQAYAYQRLKRFDDALTCYQEAKNLSPEDPQIDYLIGVLWGNKGEYEKALVSFEIALRLKHDFVDAMLGKGLMLAKLGRTEEAKACANKLLEFKGSVKKPQEPTQETAMSRSKNEEIRSQYNAAQKRFTSQYSPNQP